jgi:dTDP-L-rhamnose 4-epimerase
MRVLITGGAGFIGSHLGDALLRDGHHVRALDSLVEQVHGCATRPPYLAPDIELLVGDVRDPGAVRRALHGVDAVYHFAARVGVGQSMYQIAEYTSANAGGTAILLEALARQPVGRLVVASSMSVYGEGLYMDRDGQATETAGRTTEQLRQRVWDPLDAQGHPLQPVPTPESKRPSLSSVYALGKFDQERMTLMVGQAYDIPTVALRFFNVYGPRQALSNPYTGVLAIFAARLLNQGRPLVYEDGRQQRDFVHVADITQACRLALEQPASHVAGRAFNVGSGEAWCVSDVAALLSRTLGVDRDPEMTGKARVGDIRHCFADITAARTHLGFRPSVGLREGLRELCAWLEDQRPEDRVMSAAEELSRRGLTA